MDLEKAFHRVTALWEVLKEHGVKGPMLRSVRLLYNLGSPILLRMESSQLRWLGHVSDASWTPPLRGVPGMSHWKEALGKT